MSKKPTESELAILKILWERGPCTVRQVHEALEPQTGAGYTTILKFLQIMTEKGSVTRDEQERAHVYSAALDREETERTFVKGLVDRMFGGSAAQLVMRALDSGQATDEELSEIRLMIDGYRRRKTR